MATMAWAMATATWMAVTEVRDNNDDDEDDDDVDDNGGEG